MLRLAFQGLRGRKGPFAGAFVALAVAAALVMACGALLQAGLQSHASPERYSGAPIVLAGDQWAKINQGTENEDSIALLERARVDSSVAQRAAAVRGVRAAIADRSTLARIDTARGSVDGPGGHPTAVHPWASAALTPYVLRAGHAPAGPHDLVVDAGMAARGHLRLGERVRLASNGPARTMTVAGIAATAADVDKQGVMFVTSAESDRLAALPGRVDAVGVLLDRGADRSAVAARLRAALHGDARVVTGSKRGEVEHVEALEAQTAVIAIAGTFGGLALLIAMFVVSSTIGLGVLQREREVALLRAVAATPRQIRRMIRWEAIVVGLFAAGLGVLPGAALASALGKSLSERGIAPEDMHVPVGIVPVVVAVGSAVLTALGAVVAAGRRAARVQPTQALQESATEPRLIGPVRILGGLASLGGAIALLVVIATSGDAALAVDAAGGVSLALVMAVVFLGPLIVRMFAWAGATLLGRRGNATAALALSNMRTSSRRYASAITPLVLTVAVSGTLLFQATTRDHAAAEQGADRVTADLVLHADGDGVPASAAAEARRIAGVDVAVGTATTTLGPSLGATHQSISAAVVDPRGIDRVLDLDVKSGSLAGLRHGEVALSDWRAQMADAGVGDRVDLVLGDGAHRSARVAAVYERGLGFGDVVLPTAVGAGHRTSPLLDAVLIRTSAGASPERVMKRLQKLAARYPGLTVSTSAELAAAVDQERETNNWLFRILSAIVFAFTAIAVVNTLTMIALHRGRELALLQLVGATARQVRSMARWEAAAVVALGVGMGAAIALITLIPEASILSGSAIPYAPMGLVALVAGGAATVAFGGSQLATRLAMRARPVDAIGVGE